MKKFSLFPSVLLFALIFCVASELFAEVILKPENLVIVTEKKHEKTGKILADFLLEITKVKIPVAEKVQAGKYPLYIGKVPAGKKVIGSAVEEAYWQLDAKEGYFYGNKPASVEYIVFDFLEKELGVRYIHPEISVTPAQNPLKIKNSSGKFLRNLVRSEVRWNRDKTHYLWYQRLRSSCDINVFQLGHAFTWWWSRYGKEHPEYFALVQGRRYPISPLKNAKRNAKNDLTLNTGKTSTIISMCVSNQKVVDQIIKNWNGKTPVINICENDSPAWNACHCANCRALDANPKGELSNNMGADRYVDFGNRVVKAAKKIRKDAKVFYYAYNASEQPPVKTKIAEDCHIGISPTDFRHKELFAYVHAWKKAGMKTFVYRPNYHHYFCPMGFPLGNDRFTYKIHEFMTKEGVIGFDYDAPQKWDFFRWRLDYILHHAMLDPGKSFEYWEKHFANSFGPAAKEVLAYCRYWTKVWEERIEKDVGKLTGRKNWYYFSREFYPRVDQYYTSKDFTLSGKYLHTALNKKLDVKVRKVLQDLKLFHDHASLMLKCFQTRKKEDVQLLIAFRKKNHMDILMPYEKEYEDPLQVRAINDMAVPKASTPELWYFKLDEKNEGIKKKYFLTKDFSKWDGMMPVTSSWEKPVIIKGHPSAQLRKRTANYNGTAYYGQKITVPAKWKGTKILLYFGAVDETAEVWVNGKFAGKHLFLKPDDWKTPFAIDITKQVDWNSKEQTVIVRVTDKLGAGGIWKGVEIRSEVNWKRIKAFLNLSFDSIANGLCSGWSNNALACTENPRQGKACMKQKSNGGYWDVVMNQTLYKVNPGDRYKISVWNRNTLIGGSAQFSIRFADIKRQTIKNGYTFWKVAPGKREWKQYEQEFTIPSNCHYINIYFKVNKPVGDVFWDSVELYRVEK